MTRIVPNKTDEFSRVEKARFPEAGKFTLATATAFDGAELEVLAINSDWSSCLPPETSRKPISERVLPSAEQVRDSLFAPNEAIRTIRDWSQYACHDLRVVTRKPDGSLLYLATRRLEPGWLSNFGDPETRPSVISSSKERAQHSAPINGTWWPPGGRIVVPRPGSELAREGFDAVDSALLKLNKEIGTKPEDVLGIFMLGVGETNFEEKMTYHYTGKDQAGEAYGFSLPVQMPAPQRSINKNYVVELRPEALISLDGLSSACWIDEDAYQIHRGQFCEYEQQFVNAVFGLAL
jgi:hypothetical protein